LAIQPGHPAHGEHHREHVQRNAHRPQDDAAVEIDVRIQLALDEIVVVSATSSSSLGNIQQRIAGCSSEPASCRRLLENLGARIEVLVDPMPEAHQLQLGVFGLDPTTYSDTLMPDWR
jgi:hypothetical protein